MEEEDLEAGRPAEGAAQEEEATRSLPAIPSTMFRPVPCHLKDKEWVALWVDLAARWVLWGLVRLWDPKGQWDPLDTWGPAEEWDLAALWVLDLGL